MNEAEEDIVARLARLLTRLDTRERRKCPNCGSIPPTKANYCDKCGRGLAEAGKRKPRVKVKKIRY
ncbi:TPA: hypothetical protein EYP26_01850 [Candidatus Bathyarchaeota archaeon]|nr:hypothetical protein [Candidatus Bathyarchaeota archaeon]